MHDDGFDDPFGPAAERYARYRPRYPRALYERIASEAPATQRCWDCATGSGQAAIDLVDYFDEVVATDASEQQIARAPGHPRVDFRCEHASSTTLPEASVDAVTVASALHWLPRPAFYEEVRRVARPGAVIAAWTYSTRIASDPPLEALIEEVVGERLAPFWTPAYADVAAGYRNLTFPFVELESERLAIQARWSRADLVGYVNTWSAAVRYEQARGRPVLRVDDADLLRAWGDVDRPRTVRLPLHLCLGRVTDPGR